MVRQDPITSPLRLSCSTRIYVDGIVDCCPEEKLSGKSPTNHGVRAGDFLYSLVKCEFLQFCYVAVISCSTCQGTGRIRVAKGWHFVV